MGSNRASMSLPLRNFAYRPDDVELWATFEAPGRSSSSFDDHINVPRHVLLHWGLQSLSLFGQGVPGLVSPTVLTVYCRCGARGVSTFEAAARSCMRAKRTTPSLCDPDFKSCHFVARFLVLKRLSHNACEATVRAVVAENSRAKPFGP